MKAKGFWVGGIVILLLAVTIGIASATQGGVFEGAWFAQDIDGSNEWMWITEHFGVYEVVLYDDMCTACENSLGEHPSCLLLGSGRVDDANILTMDDGTLFCYWQEGAAPLDWFSWEGSEAAYDPITDTLTDAYLTWERSNDKKVEKIIDPTTFPKCIPSPEVCDGIDNDCDGIVDEGCTSPTTCTSDADCIPAMWCDSNTYTCSVDRPNEGYCIRDAQCMSGVCDITNNVCTN